MLDFDYSVVIPTLNAEGLIEKLIEQLWRQSIRPKEILVIDSSSNDRTVQVAYEKGVRVKVIDRKDFDHGKTRDWAVKNTESPIIVFMTQDAMPVNEYSVERLIAPLFENEKIAVSGGRQIAYQNAKQSEKIIRSINYPTLSRVWGLEDLPQLGVRAFLISNVFSAYRRTAYCSVGGFDNPILTNEDMLITQKFLDAGFLVSYRGDAEVFHSHNFSWKAQYRRNYIVGRTMVRYADRFHNVKEIGEGAKLAKNVIVKLAEEKKIVDIFDFAIDCSARLLGNKVGRTVEKIRGSKK